MCILREKQVTEITKLSRMTIWRMEKRGDFPARFRISKNAVGWLQSEIDAWLEEKAAQRQGAAK